MLIFHKRNNKITDLLKLVNVLCCRGDECMTSRHFKVNKSASRIRGLTLKVINLASWIGHLYLAIISFSARKLALSCAEISR